MTASPITFAVVIPMFDEEAGAQRCIGSVVEVLRDYPGARLIVVDDGSSDSTPAILRSLASDHPMLAVTTHETNRGYGAAIASGVSAASALGVEYALFMDSDLTNDPADIPKFVEVMERGAGVIKATRFRSGGGMRGVPAKRAVVSRIGSIVAAALFRIGLSDCTNGFRAARVSLLRQVRYSERGFPVIMEELVQLKMLGASFAEVPVILTNRRTDQRPTAFAYRPEVFRRYLAYCLRAFRAGRS